MGDTGFVKVNLAKEWCGRSFGDEVEVDPERAEWMRENGFVMEEEMVAGLIGQPLVQPADQTQEAELQPEPEYPDHVAGSEDWTTDDLSPYDPDKEI